MLDKLRHCFPTWSHTAEARHEQFAALRRQIPLFLFVFFLNALIATATIWYSAPRGITVGWASCLLTAAIVLFITSAPVIDRRTDVGATRRTLGWVIASALILGVAGAAAAQQAPVYSGNYGPAVVSQLEASGAQVVTGNNAIDYTATASIKAAPMHDDNPYIVDHSGR